MDQNELTEIFNRHLFSEEKRTLLSKIADNPDRFVGIFRSTSPRLKLMQNLLQSREIRYGDALEEVMAQLITEMGFTHLPKALLPQDEDELSCDHYFARQDHSLFYLVEQKIRDDHDSTKKRGQFANFRKKVSHLREVHGELIVGIIYFIDPSLTKNRNYYHTELIRLREELQVPMHLFYNGELFAFLQGSMVAWDRLVAGLQAWQSAAPDTIDFDFDATPEKSIVEIQTVAAGHWNKLITDERLWVSNVMPTLFPTGATLLLLRDTFLQRGSEKFRAGRRTMTYSQLTVLMQQRLEKQYGYDFPPTPGMLI